MARVVVDSNVLIAARLTRDQNHDRGRAIAEGIDRGDLPSAFVPTDVLAEVLNYLQARSTHAAATGTLDALVESSGFEVEFTPKADLETGRSLFRTHEGLSLTDAVIAAFARRRDLEYLYSFDDGFDAVSGLTRLTTPDDPLGE